MLLQNIVGGSGDKSLEKAARPCTSHLFSPGENNFFTHELRNGSSQPIIYSVRISDPDISNYGLASSELTLVSDSTELMHWVQMGKVSRPSSSIALLVKMTSRYSQARALNSCSSITLAVTLSILSSHQPAERQSNLAESRLLSDVPTQNKLKMLSTFRSCHAWLQLIKQLSGMSLNRVTS